MSKYITQTSLEDISRIELYINKNKLPLSKIVSQLHPDIAITGNFYSGAWKPVCPLKSDGTVHCVDRQYAYPSLVWNTGPDIHMELIPKGGATPAKNYITNCVGLVNNETQTMYYGSDVGGRRGRTGWGFCNGALSFIAFPDGADGMTPEQTRDYVKGMGWSDFILGDGGGKVNFYDRKAGVMLQGKAASQNLILVYFKKKEDKTTGKKYTVCLDPGHGVETAGKCSPDKSYYEHEFALDMGKRIKDYLEQNGVNVVMTRADQHCPTRKADTNDLNYRVKVSDNANADLFVSLHSNAQGGTGWGTVKGYGIYTSSGPETASRNVCARKLLDRAMEAGVPIWGGGLFHDIDLLVTRKTKAPAVLIEHGFHTSKEETELLKTTTYRDKLAQVDAKGILDFLGVVWEEKPVNKPVDTQASSWAAEAWEKAVRGNVFDGTNPQGVLTREQAAVVLDRLGLI